MTKRAILYARVSTDEQGANGYSLPTQLDACRQEAARRNLPVAAELTFTDDCGGATLDRPNLARLRAALRPGDTIIVYDPDRLSRDDVDFLVICREFKRAGSELVFVNGGQVPDSAVGDIIRYMMGWRGKLERAQVRERTLRGRRAKAAAGKWVGSSHPPYGYRRTGQGRDCRLEMQESEAQIVRSIFRRFVAGESILGIANSLTAAHVPPPSRSKAGQQWYQTSVKRFLRSRIYLGCIEQYGQTVRDMKLAIVHLGTWEAAQARLASNRREFSNGRKNDYLLSGFLECMCGHKMHGCHVNPRNPKSYLYYICSARNHREGDCRESVIPLAKVDAIVWGWIIDILCDDERRETGLREYAARRAGEAAPLKTESESVDELIAKAQRKVNRYAAALGDEEDELAAAVLRQQMQIAAQELAHLQARRAQIGELLEQREFTQDKIDDVRRMAVAVKRRLPGNPTHVQKRDLLDVLSVNVTLRRDEGGRRWLDLSCGIPDWGLQAEMYSSATRSC